jgi:hypothetical protein
MLKKGDKFYHVSCFEGKIDVEEYHLRTIRKGVAFLTVKNVCTWGKKSKKHFDYGWLDPVESTWRTRHPVDKPISKHNFLARSKLAAAKKTLATIRGIRKTRPDWIEEEDLSDIKILERYIKRGAK